LGSRRRGSLGLPLSASCCDSTTHTRIGSNSIKTTAHRYLAKKKAIASSVPN
jgi:hypothetical protein